MNIWKNVISLPKDPVVLDTIKITDLNKIRDLARIVGSTDTGKAIASLMSEL